MSLFFWSVNGRRMRAIFFLPAKRMRFGVQALSFVLFHFLIICLPHFNFFFFTTICMISGYN